jgi:hypothetical protein
MNMKKILYLTLGAALLLLASCRKMDNWAAPGSRLYGNVIDKYTGTNLAMDNNDWQIRIWDKTWEVMNPGAVAQYQSLAVKMDGSYNDTKLFPGTYNMLPYDGPFWPADTIKGVVLGNETQQDFTVIPYLQVTNFNATLADTLMTLTCNVKAPIITGLPNFYEVKGFISLTTFCGNANYINITDYNNLRKSINKTWAAEVGVADNKDYTLGPYKLQRHYTYYVRIGANVNALSRRYNYSPILKVVVP